MSDQPVMGAESFAHDDRPQLSAVVDGDEVRELVARSEQQIAVLLGELARARQEADEAERRVTEHPSAIWLDALPEALAITPDAPLTDSVSGPSPVPSVAVPVATNGRTVVDHRSSSAELPRPATSTTSATSATPATSARPSHRQRSRRPRRRRQRSGRARLHLASILTTGWLWKAGVAIVIAALVLLKLG